MKKSFKYKPHAYINLIFLKNLEIKLILQFFLGASAGTGVPRNTHKIGTQCGCEYGYKNYESFGSLLILNRFVLRFGQNKARGTAVRGRSKNYFCIILNSGSKK